MLGGVNGVDHVAPGVVLVGDFGHAGRGIEPHHVALGVGEGVEQVIVSVGTEEPHLCVSITSPYLRNAVPLAGSFPPKDGYGRGSSC